MHAISLSVKDYKVLKEAEWSISDMQAGLKADAESEHYSSILKKIGQKRHIRIKSVANIPCGWGRHDAVLRRNGFDVYGIDIEPYFISKARRLYPRFKNRYFVGDMRCTGLESGTFDAVLNVFTSFGYFGYKGNLQVLHEFNRLLRKGGILLFDVKNKPALLRVMKGNKVMNAEFASSSIIRSHKTVVAGGYLVFKEQFLKKTGDTYRLVKTEEKRVMLFSLREMRSMLAHSGFKVVGVYEKSSFRSAGRDTPHVFIAAVKL